MLMSRPAFLFLKRIDKLKNSINSIDIVLCDSAIKGWEFFLFSDGVFNLELLTKNDINKETMLDKKLRWLVYSEDGIWNVHMQSCNIRNIGEQAIKSFNKLYRNVKWLDDKQFKEKIVNYRSIISFV